MMRKYRFTCKSYPKGEFFIGRKTIFKNDQLSDRDKLIFLFLRDQPDDHPIQKSEVMAEMHYSKKMVDQTFIQLRRCGYLRYNKSYKGRGKIQNFYTFHEKP